MKIANLKIVNYRGLRDIEIPFSHFVCLIGENNTGKSSILQCLSLFFSGSKLDNADYFDESHNVKITVTFVDIGDTDINHLAEEHRSRISNIVKDSKLVLIREYDTSGKSSLKYMKSVPDDNRFEENNIAELLSKQRPGRAFVDRVTGVFPELADNLTTSMNQTQVREQVEALADSWPEENRKQLDAPLPTGIDRSISAMLPEPIYIQAVKDLADDTKTKESTPFGKILKILLDAIEPSLAEEKELFEKLESKLNRIVLEDGTVQDNRLTEVVTIEKTVEKYVNESFKDVTINIKIPPPELKTVLSSAQIFANDGVESIIDLKGDGLRRAIVFAILRSYVDLNNREDLSATDTSTQGNYLLLFEEPELYLYPKAQLILFEALSVFARNNAVVVSTHSPMFLGPDATATFVKLTKTKDSSMGTKPFTEVYPVDLSDVSSKDQFQIICYENNNAAFFANTVLLVEGDSDYLVLPHLAATINSKWTTSSNSTRFAKINGKSSIKRYKTFFERFNSKVKIIADLDLLVNGFNQIEPSQELLQLQSSLLQKVDVFILSQKDEKEISSSQAKDLQEKGELKALWKKVRQLYIACQQGKVGLEKVNEAVEEFFAYERKNERLEVLKDADGEICALKNEILSKLRDKDIYVLEKGAIEDYYPDGIEGADKPSRAQSFCNSIRTREAALELCNEVVVSENGETKKEFELIFENIFDQ